MKDCVLFMSIKINAVTCRTYHRLSKVRDLQEQFTNIYLPTCHHTNRFAWELMIPKKFDEQKCTHLIFNCTQNKIQSTLVQVMTLMQHKLLSQRQILARLRNSCQTTFIFEETQYVDGKNKLIGDDQLAVVQVITIMLVIPMIFVCLMQTEPVLISKLLGKTSYQSKELTYTLIHIDSNNRKYMGDK